MVSLASGSDSIGKAFENLPLSFDKTNTSSAIPNSQEPGYSPIFRNSATVEKGLINTVHPDLTTVYDYFEYAVKVYGKEPCIARRLYEDGVLNDHYSFTSYEDVQKLRNQLGSGILKIVELYPSIDSQDFILSLYSANKYEWVVADLASHAFSIPNVALYDTLGAESSTHILNITKSPIILLSKDKINTILQLKQKPEDLSTLKILISMEKLEQGSDAELITEAEKKGIKIYDFDDVLSIGSKYPFAVRPPKPSDIYTISFTSGTTSLPKGCCLTHANAVCGITFCWVHVDPPPHPKSLAFLPLAHVLERFKVLYELSHGAAVCFPHDPTKVTTFLDDIKILEPTHMCAVPRLYNRIEAGIRDKIKSGSWLQRKIVEAAISYKVRAVTHQTDDSIICKIINYFIINKIKQKIGFKNLNFLISGSAPLSEQTIIFLKAVLNCGFYQGYGLTESFAAAAITVPKDPHPNSCGPIGVTTEFRLRDLPHMEYSYDQNRSGELMMRGPQIFDHYFANKELTEQAKDKDGWFATGDVAKLTDEGNKLIIIDRAKNFFKLSQGEYVAAEKIENIYLSNVTFLNQLFIYGDSFQSYLVGILNVDPILFVKFLNKLPVYENIKHIDEVDLNDLNIRKLVLKHCNTAIAPSGLFGFEKFKNLKIGVDIFKVENDVITPTLKVKRPQAKKFFITDIEKMYEEGVL